MRAYAVNDEEAYLIRDAIYQLQKNIGLGRLCATIEQQRIKHKKTGVIEDPPVFYVRLTTTDGKYLLAQPRIFLIGYSQRLQVIIKLIWFIF